MALMVHASDLYTPTKPTEVSRIWVQLLNKEFVGQSKAEKERGLPETPFFKGLDSLAVVAKSEIFFVGKLVQPLWQKVNNIFKKTLVIQAKNIDINLEYWKKTLEIEESKEHQILQNEN